YILSRRNAAAVKTKLFSLPLQRWPISFFTTGKENVMGRHMYRRYAPTAVDIQELSKNIRLVSIDYADFH
ncbi:MAG: hypothetical protein QG657_1735, partial [Acidobacteriota bacterium]|nr:hypothetical protein [Acidobacteriota bacterium]